MNKKLIVFGDTEIEKQKFHCHKILVLIDDVDIDKILILNKILFGKNGLKLFVGYNYKDKKVKPLCIML